MSPDWELEYQMTKTAEQCPSDDQAQNTEEVVGENRQEGPWQPTQGEPEVDEAHTPGDTQLERAEPAGRGDDHRVQELEEEESDPELDRSNEPVGDTAANGRTRRKKANMRAAITLASLNMRGGGLTSSRDKWNNVNQLMRDGRIGILALQETHITEDEVKSLEERFTHLTIKVSPHLTHPKLREGVAIVLNNDNN
jgi:hypothetical protein